MSGPTSFGVTVLPPRSARGQNDERRAGQPAPASQAKAPESRVLRSVGHAVIGAQFVALVVWSGVQTSRFSLTWDFSIYFQAFQLIAHGHLDPYDTLNGFSFWRNHGEFLMWPLGLMGAVWPHPVLLECLQDAAIVVAELTIFSWIRREVSGLASPTLRWAIAAGSLAMMLANPWIYWTAAFDFHMEIVGLAFVLAAAWFLRWKPADPRLWLCVALAWCCGDVVTTYMAAAGLGAALAGGTRRRLGLSVAVGSVIWTALLRVMGADLGSGLVSGYGYLVSAGVGGASLWSIASGLVTNPHAALGVLWSRRVDLYAATASTGFLGLVSAWTMPALLATLLENGLNRSPNFLVPGFQDAPIFLFGVAGTAAVLAALARVRPWVAVTAVGVATLYTVGWAAVWMPRLPGQWLRTSPAAAQVLRSALERMGPSDEVVGSQGILGPFSGRESVQAISGPGPVPVQARTVWVVIAPGQGIETQPSIAADDLVQEMAARPDARLVAGAAGIWVFRWRPPPQVHTLVVPSNASSLGAWVVPGPAGTSRRRGPSAHWVATTTGRPGYVVAGDYWPVRQAGLYRATTVLSASGAVSVEIWDTSHGTLLGRRTLPGTRGFLTLSQVVRVDDVSAPLPFQGTGPFRMSPVAPPSGAQVEIRVWSPDGAAVSVSTLALAPLSPSSTSASS